MYKFVSIVTHTIIIMCVSYSFSENFAFWRVPCTFNVYHLNVLVFQRVFHNCLQTMLNDVVIIINIINHHNTL